MTTRSDVHAHHHAVKFYGTDASLFATVASFLSEGLVANQPAIVIATGEHREGIFQGLTARFIDVDRARHNGDLVAVDARATLDLFLVDEAPDADLFERHVGGLIEETLRDRPRTVVRAYGEMVNLLWKDGLTDSAIALEMLWNKLAQTHGFALLCGYSMGQFYKQPASYEDVRRQHTHAESDTDILPFPPRRAVR